MITIKLKHGLQPEEEKWLAKNVGPRFHYLHNSIGGKGWIAKLYLEEEVRFSVDGDKITGQVRKWKLMLEDERYASWFLMMFPQ
jgi:hypothetical protein